VATLEWVDWFNRRRLLEPIGHIPPAEFDEMYYAKARECDQGGRTQLNESPGFPGRFNPCWTRSSKSASSRAEDGGTHEASNER